MMFVAAYSRNADAAARRIMQERRRADPASLPAPKPEPAPVAAYEPEKAVDLEAIRKMRARGMPEWAREILVAVAEKRGVAIHDLLGPSRSRLVIVPARNEVFYLLRTGASPTTGKSPSWPQIGRWFGRDHSSALYGASKHAYLNGLPVPSAWDFKTKMTERRERARRRKRVAA